MIAFHRRKRASTGFGHEFTSKNKSVNVSLGWSYLGSDDGRNENRSYDLSQTDGKRS
jgi:hypothetical protein